jgi:uncharacterized RmlC-like cupin family protein
MNCPAQSPQMDTSGIQKCLDENRCETARRLCLRELESGGGANRNELLFLLHRACRFLGDPIACREALAQVVPQNEDEELEVLLRQAEDARRFATGVFYYDSEACQQGLSQWEYFEIMRNRVNELLATAQVLARTDTQKERLAASRKISEESQFDGHAKSVNNVIAPPSPARAGTCGLRGRITFADGTPARNLPLTLGLEVAHLPHDPKRYTNTNIEVYEPAHSVLETVGCRTDDNGHYHFENLPAGTHEFLSVNLDPQEVPIAVRFLAHHIELRDGEAHEMNGTISEWTSVPARQPQATLAETIPWQGDTATLVATDKLLNPFDFTFPRQLLEMDLPEGVPPDSALLVLQSSDLPGVPVPFQISGKRILYFSDLPANHDRLFGLYQTNQAVEQPEDSPLKIVEDGAGVVLVVTGRAEFRLPGGEGGDLIPPILQVKGTDGIWRGNGRLFLPEDVSLVSRNTTVLERGPLRLQVHIHYELSGGLSYSFKLTFHRDEPYVLVHETSPAIEGARFEFSLAEFLGGRYFLNNGNGPEGGKNRSWNTLAPSRQTIGKMKETQSFGVKLEAFSLFMSKDSVEEKDCIGVFTLRRGEWIDRAFDKVSHGPAKAGYSHEQEWPFPEMIGSSISMITAETEETDCLFRFNSFDGERHWGLMVASFDENDGRFKAVSEYHHKNSSLRLQEFKKWRLDLPSAIVRPSILVQAERLPELRRRKMDPRFAEEWRKIEAMRPNGGGQWGPSAAGAFRAMLAADPALVWNKKRELTAIAVPHARSVLLGRENTRDYGPVPSRCVPPWIEDYDLIAATGVFTPDEERLVRSHHMLMGHMYLQKDFMNWTFNARNANFESDRVDAVAIAGLCFRDNPDGKAFIAHAQSRMAKIIETYSTPGSGKWYENPACYYLVSVKNWTSLFVHMAHHGLIRIEDVPAMKDFLRWGILLLTPPTPEYETMCQSVPAEAYDALVKKRRIAPIGDHAHLGPTIPETYPLIAACYRESDPEFADLLRWAYHASGANGADHGQPLLFFANADEWMLSPPATSPELPSRRLEAFGAVLRGNQNRSNESYVLLKLGPGGYRYHSTEGSIIFFADGKPLLYDGGEAGEAWRHSTLSFYDTHTMLAPGHVERFFDNAQLGFTQGVSPKALKPGEPNYLNDTCRPEDTETGYRNYHEPKPANSRTLFWVKDEYLLIHDALDIDADIPSHWHLQVVGEAHVGDVKSGWRFQGRFGTDLQVVLVDHDDAAVRIEQTPILESQRTPEESFSMRHLQVSGRKGTAGYLAVLRPLAKGRSEIQAASLSSDGRTIGAQVSGDGINDTLYFSRELFAHQQGEIGFRGKFAAVLRRADSVTLNLFDGESLACGNLSISSTGPAVSVHQSRQGTRIAAKGKGSFAIKEGGETRLFEVNGEFKEDTDAGSSTSIPSLALRRKRNRMQTTFLKRKAEMPSKRLDRCHDGNGAIDWIGVLDGESPGGDRLRFIHDDILPPGTSIGIHRHTSDQEYYYIVSGRGVMTLDGREFEVAAGDITAVLPGGSHGLENRSDGDIRVIVISVTGGET